MESCREKLKETTALGVCVRGGHGAPRAPPPMWRPSSVGVNGLPDIRVSIPSGPPRPGVSTRPHQGLVSAAAARGSAGRSGTGPPPLRALLGTPPHAGLCLALRGAGATRWDYASLRARPLAAFWCPRPRAGEASGEATAQAGALPEDACRSPLLLGPRRQ